MTSSLNLDPLGFAYIGITVGWTSIVVIGMVFLWRNRFLPFLQIRRLHIAFTGIVFLHGYWMFCMIGYVILPLVPCDAEYWTMSAWLPLGIAMFQVANTQFLHIASSQRAYSHVETLDDLLRVEDVRSTSGSAPATRIRIGMGMGMTGLIHRLRRLDRISRIILWISLGLTIQLAVAIFIYFGSRKFHHSYGFLPVELAGTALQIRMNCSRGWEWWPSIVWQFFWSWIYAPYILWNSRGIHDTRGWRLQTILCCLSGLPASPLWLASLYAHGMAPVNMYFIPPQWFSFSTTLLESFTIFIPCIEVFKHRALEQQTLDAIEDWNQKSKDVRSIDSDSTRIDNDSTIQPGPCLAHKISQRRLNNDSRKESMLTLAALDHALRSNVEPLQKFAALRDFSGENISFLTHVAEWKRRWQLFGAANARLNTARDENAVREQFNKAIRIYAAFVSDEFAKFPINLASKELTTLEAVFAEPSRILFGRQDSICTSSATPFLTEKSIIISSTDVASYDSAWYWGPIPHSFDEKIFDQSETVTKHLVLTNTWPKFVKERCHENVEGGSVMHRLTKYVHLR